LVKSQERQDSAAVTKEIGAPNGIFKRSTLNHEEENLATLILD
jgi:hypothetical protein